MQREAVPEEEEATQAKFLQKQEEEEEVQTQPEEEEVQTKLLQREADEEEEVQKQPEEEEETAQAKGDGGSSTAAPSVESGINSIRGGGQPLPESSRAFFEPRFGIDFSGVKVHTGANANHLARSINAKAFTLGKDVVFGSGQYSPETISGKSLLAHELTHVAQQAGGDAFSSIQIVKRPDNGMFGQKADSVANTDGVVLPMSPVPNVHSMMLQRKEACIKEERIPEKHDGVTVLQGLVYDHFEMNIDWNKAGPGCKCRCGEYRQYVKGYVKVNGKKIPKKLYKNAELVEDEYHEDAGEEEGRPLSPYGHRDGWENSSNDRFIDPDGKDSNRKTACSYRGIDTPGPKNTRSGDRIDMHLTFKGQTYDNCKKTHGKINEWETKWKGRLP